MAEQGEITTDQERIIGQMSAIGRFNPEDPEDMAGLQEIIDSKEAQHWMDEVVDLTGDDLKRWAAKESPDEYLFAVRGSQNVLFPEFGKIQGFINIYRSKTLPGAFEVSYAKRLDIARHQMASALRQTLIKFNSLFFIDNNNGEGAPSIQVISDPSTTKEGLKIMNDDSIRTLEAAGFVQDGEIWKLDWNKLDKIIDSSRHSS